MKSSVIVRVHAGLLALSLIFVACRPDTIVLTYRYAVGETHSASLTATALAGWTFSDGTRGHGTYRMTAEVEETVRSVDADGAILDVLIRPDEITEQNLSSPGSEVRAFSLRVDATGRVVRVLSVGGSPAIDLTPEETAFIGSFRPLLPAGEVEVGEDWQARGTAGASMFDQSTTVGALTGLDRIDGTPCARIATSVDGPAVWRTTLPQGDASLTGTVSSSGTALMDLDRGRLREARIEVNGSFEVRIAQPDRSEQPLAGVLDLSLQIEVRAKS